MKSLLMMSLAAAVITAAIAMPFTPIFAAENETSFAAEPGTRQAVGSQGPLPIHAKFTSAQIKEGGELFVQNCAFCHGKDAGGGETGPDLTRSKIVSGDKNGEAIGAVIHGGRPDKGMPAFSLASADVTALVAFIHSQQDKAMSQSGDRKGVEPQDLLTGSSAAGKLYFETTGGCTKCHSVTGDLAGVATRLTGLKLEEEMLYPTHAKVKVSVKTLTGQNFTGTESYKDEFVLGMTDTFGVYHSWPVTAIIFKEDDPAQAHVDAFAKYTDEDIHNLYAYIQTLK